MVTLLHTPGISSSNRGADAAEGRGQCSLTGNTKWLPNRDPTQPPHLLTSLSENNRMLNIMANVLLLLSHFSMSVALYMGARKMAEGTTGGANDTGPCVVFSCWALWPRSKVPSSKAHRTGTTSTTGMSLSSHPVLYSQGIFPLPSSRAARCLQLLICTRMFVFSQKLARASKNSFFNFLEDFQIVSI